MNLAWRFVGLASCVYVVSASACGGKVRGDPGAAGNGGSDMGATSGPAGTGATGSTTSGTTGSTTTGAGGTGTEPIATCESVCRRFMNYGCQAADPMSCVGQCEAARAGAIACGTLFDEVLFCLERTPNLCGPDGTLQAPECLPLLDKLSTCRGGLPPPPIDAGPSQCGGIVPPGPMSCSGGGGAVATAGTGGTGQPTCMTECTDRNMNTWASKCVGTSCVCTYNGMQYCSCFVSGPSCLGARSCCPGLP